MKSGKTEFSIKASSTVEGFFQHHCERNLLFNGIKEMTRKEFGLNKPYVKGDNVAADAGDKWEKEVIEQKIPEGHLKYKMAEKEYGKFDAASMEDLFVSTSAEVKNDKQTRYIYQGLLIETDTFRKLCYKKLPESWYNNTNPYIYVHMALTYPDLMRLSWDDEKDKVTVSVVDCKLAEKMQLKHKAQISLYVRLLWCMFEEYHSKGILEDTVVDTETAFLWNRGQETERPFSVNDIDSFIDEFFTETLPGLLQKVYNSVRNGKERDLKKDLYVCTSQTCEWCENYHQCLEELKKKGSISLLPYISQYAQEHIRATGAPDTVSGILEYINTPANRERLTGNRSWERILEDKSMLELHEKAHPYEGELPEHIWKTNVKSYILPSWQDNTLILTAQKDVGTGYVYALGFYIREKLSSVEADGNIKWKDPTYQIFVSESPTEEAYLENATNFISVLLEKLYQLKDMKIHNRNGELVPASFQAYVMDSYELKNLEDMLYDLIDRKTLSDEFRNKAISLLLWIQGDRIISDSDTQPEKEIDHPILVISQSIRSLVHLPLTIAYDIRGIQSSMKVYIDDEYYLGKGKSPFFETISNAIPSEVINYIWYGNKKETITMESLRKHILKRFVYSIKILTKLQIEGKNALVNSAGKLELPDRQAMSPVLVSKWAFENRNEELLAYHMIRSERMKDIKTALKEGGIIEGNLLKIEEHSNGRYQNTYIKLEFNSLGDYRATRWFSAIAALANQDGLYALQCFTDLRYANCFPNQTYYGNKAFGISFIKWSSENGNMILEGQINGDNVFINMLRQAYNAHSPLEFYVCERYTDINSPKTAGALLSLNDYTKSHSGKVHRLLEPENLNTDTGDSYKNDCEALDDYSKMDGKSFTESQKKAFIHLYENTLTVLQGPPGTGKTDFIARAVITLCRFFKNNKKRDLRVLVSANSHAAIENVLFGILNKMTPGVDDISVIKAGRLDNGANSIIINNHELKAINDKLIVGEHLQNPQKPVIVGATNWSCDKMEGAAFDLIIYDEASQVRIMDAMIGLLHSTEETRFLFVGDDDQLSPIIHGNYRKEPGVPYDYGSVFSFYKDRCNDNGCSFMLEENFRMNDMLVRYSAEKIYSDKYRAFNAEIGTRHLEYVDCEASEHIRYILDDLRYEEDDYWPLVLCRISGGTASDRETAERDLVKDLTLCMRKAIGNGINNDKLFWNDGNGDGRFGIISPHHKHIEKLKDDISSGPDGMDRSVLYIGTVDKLQGQQRDAIIVSYGVTDIEQAAVEGEFLFSRNRLNVSLTRGKCKTIVVFSEVLTHCPVEVFASDDEDIQNGASYVCGLYDFMKHEEQDTRVSCREFAADTGDGGSVTVEILRKRVDRRTSD